MSLYIDNDDDDTESDARLPTGVLRFGNVDDANAPPKTLTC